MRGAWMYALLAGCADSPHSKQGFARPETQLAALQGAQPADAASFAVAICTGGAPGACMHACSGVVLAPNLVATARHCVDDAPIQIDCTSSARFGGARGPIWITNQPNSRLPDTEWRAVEHVLRQGDDRLCGNDIALLILTELLPDHMVIPAAPHLAIMNSVQPFVAVGYGASSPVARDGGQRRSRDAVEMVCVPGVPNQECGAGSPRTEFVAGSGPCGGDSGSGAFDSIANHSTSAPAVAFGILSRGTNSASGQTCATSIYSRFDLHADWLRASVRLAAWNGALYTLPAWAEPPTPASSSDVVSTPAGNGGCRVATDPRVARQPRIASWLLVATGLLLLRQRTRRRAKTLTFAAAPRIVG